MLYHIVMYIFQMQCCVYLHCKRCPSGVMISNHISCEFHRFFFFKHMTELFLNVNECLIQEICINITSPLNLQCLLKFCKKKKNC